MQTATKIVLLCFIIAIPIIMSLQLDDIVIRLGIQFVLCTVLSVLYIIMTKPPKS